MAQTLVVASQNPVKVEAVARAFERAFPEVRFEVETVSVPSGVRDQPISDEETLTGALGRAEAAARELPEADFWVGVEGGIEDGPLGMMAFAWIVVLGSTPHHGAPHHGAPHHGAPPRGGRGRSAAFFLPPEVAELVRGGMELGEADDRVFARHNSKQGDGAVGLLTGNLIDRRRLYEEAVVLALIPFLNEELFPA